MKTKSSAHYQREYRKRLREQGLVKREVWIRPENTPLLSSIEKKLRQLEQGQLEEFNQNTGVNVMTAKLHQWTTADLYKSLRDSWMCEAGAASIELIEGVDPAIHIVMHDYGDLPIFLTVSGEQIIVESVLWPESDVNDVVNFNATVLRTHKYFPLSTISLDELNDGKSYYHMFGSLSASSILQNIEFEIEALASNVIQATSAYSHFLKTAVEA